MMFICQNCNQPFPPKRGASKNKFCSRDCFGQSNIGSLSDRLENNSIWLAECGCQIWMLSTGKGGYGQLTFDKKHMFAHRASYRFHKGEIPKGLHVLHTCDIPQCINPDHLYLGRDLENARDRVARGRHKDPPRLFGEDHPNSKITLETARAVKHAKGTGKEVAAKFGVHLKTVHAIRSGRQWRHA